MFTLAHISDPHLGPLPKPSIFQLFSKRFLGFINWQFNRTGHHTNKYLDQLVGDMLTQNPDHIAVTGDLTNLSLPSEFETTSMWLKRLGPPDKVSVIPGNHDAYVPGTLEMCKRSWFDFMADDGQMECEGFPYCRIRDGIALIGISSAVATGPFMATGKVGMKQIRDMEKLLADLSNDNLFKVVMIHHHPIKKSISWHKRLIDSELFCDTVSTTGVNLVLHGHSHKRELTALEGIHGPIPVVGVPSASNSPGGYLPGARYNLFKIHHCENKWNCLMLERGILEKDGEIVHVNQQQLIGSD